MVVQQQAVPSNAKSGSSPIAFLRDTCNVQISMSYSFKNLSLSKYLTTKLLKTTEITMIEQADIEQINIQNRNLDKQQKMMCKSIINLHTLRQKLLYPKCKKEVVPVDDQPYSEYCHTMIFESFWLKENKNNVGFTVCSVEDNSKVHLTTPFNLLLQLTNADA